ncbi:MAG TPA: YiiX/YebB-like N1pC/P60 family cysteine hydrolase [Candidatus Xenobia bacterium]|jgi:hypothetical protein
MNGISTGQGRPVQFLKTAADKAKTLGQAALGMVLDMRIPTLTPHMSEAQKNEILTQVQPGDLCLETNDAYPEWQRMEFATSKSQHTHAFIYEGKGQMLQSTTPDGVQRTDLAEYLQGRIHVKVVRPPYKSPDDVKQCLAWDAAQIGKPYNYAFDNNDTSKLYCFQLVGEGWKHMDHPIQVQLDKVGKREVYSAHSLEALPGGQTIVDDHNSFWKDQLSHWPVAAGAAGVGGALATGVAVLAGTTAALVSLPVSLLGGLALAICAGNKIQTGHFGFGAGVSEEA